jgi:peptidoglycan/LPS O-acetylase OafA/YrhL
MHPDHTAMSSVQKKHVPEIDGLRAIAVMAVTLFHLQFSWIPGGFVGVDIFFVISGYLITAGLSRELAQQGQLNLGRFYLRRARRLLPALYTALFVSAIAAFALLSHHRLAEFGSSLVASALSISNVHFYMGSGYFDSGSDYKPLLHTWSLGVEEQFYLIWPLLLLAFRPGMSRTVLLAALFFSTLAASEWLTQAAPSAGFFLTPCRIYEFVVGAALALYAKPPSARSSTSNGALILGLVLMAWGIFGFDGKTSFPGWHALVPSIGAGLVLWSGPSSHLAWLLSNPLASYLGRISYSTYLFHWPLIVLYRVAKGREHLALKEQLGLLAITLVLGALCQRFIENRYRDQPEETDRKFLTWLLICTALLVTIGWAFQQDKVAHARHWSSSHITHKEVDLRRNERFKLRQKVCETKGWDHCDDKVAGARNALIVGDSHAIDAYNAFVTSFPKDNFSLSDLGGCPPHPHIETIVLAGHPDLPKCQELNRKRFDAAHLRSFDYIVINVYMDWYDETHLASYLQFLHDNGIRKVIVLGQTFRAHDDVPELVNREGFSRERLMPLLAPPPKDGLVESTAQKLGYVYLSKVVAMSTNGQFDVFDAREVLFTYDQHHLSLPFSTRLLDKHLPEIESYLTGAKAP